MIACGNFFAQRENLRCRQFFLPLPFGAQKTDIEIGDIDAMHVVPRRPRSPLVCIGERVA